MRRLSSCLDQSFSIHVEVPIVSTGDLKFPGHFLSLNNGRIVAGEYAKQEGEGCLLLLFFLTKNNNNN